MMWAITMVQIERPIPSWEKIRSAEMPATISGVISGTSIRMLKPLAVPEWARTRPIASAVPTMVEMTMVRTAICTEVTSESIRVGSLKKSEYQRSETPASPGATSRC